MSPRLFLLLAAALVGSWVGGSASYAQERSGKRPVTSSDRAGLDERERGELHPGDPFQIVGLAESDDEFLARTPALRRSTQEVAKVDIDELYERRRSMLEGGHVFRSPPTANTPDGQPRNEPRARPVRPRDDAPSGTPMWVIASMSALAMLFASRTARRVLGS